MADREPEDDVPRKVCAEVYARPADDDDPCQQSRAYGVANRGRIVSRENALCGDINERDCGRVPRDSVSVPRKKVHYAAVTRTSLCKDELPDLGERRAPHAARREGQRQVHPHAPLRPAADDEGGRAVADACPAVAHDLREPRAPVQSAVSSHGGPIDKALQRC